MFVLFRFRGASGAAIIRYLYRSGDFLGKYKAFPAARWFGVAKKCNLAFAGVPKRSQALFGVFWLSQAFSRRGRPVKFEQLN